MIHDGFLKRTEKGHLRVAQRREPISPAEKLVTGKTKGMRSQGPAI